MKYDGLIIELFGRVQQLEEQMAEVRNLIAGCRQDDDEEIDSEIEEERYTRTEAREKTMEIIRGMYPDYLVDKAPRSSGSGITVHRPHDKKPLIIKFYHSRTFKNQSDKFEHGWHVVRLKEVIATTFDFCIFSLVDSHDNWNFFIFEPEELGMYKDEHRSREGNVLHLYFSVQGDSAFEVREKTVDVTDHLNNWGVLDDTEAQK
jgi:hypothetical protein